MYIQICIQKQHKQGKWRVVLEFIYKVWAWLKETTKRCWCTPELSLPLLKFTPTIGPLQRGHSSGHIWTTWPNLTGQNWMGQSGYLALGKSKHRIYSLYLCLVMSLSPFLSLTPEFSCRGLVIYMVIGANRNRSLRAVVIVFAILNRAPRNTQKARDLQREQVLKEDKGTDVQRIWDHRVFGPNGRGRVGSRAWPRFYCSTADSFQAPSSFLFCSTPSKLVNPRAPSIGTSGKTKPFKTQFETPHSKSTP